MKKKNTTLKNISTLILLVLTSAVYAQSYTSSGYYYNNFNSGELGAAFTQVGSSASLKISSSQSANNLTLENGYSLVSTGNGQAGGFGLSFLPAGTNLNNENYGYEWTLLYRNNGSNTDNSDVIDNNKNAWKYWLYGDNSNQNISKGYFLTQVGSTLYLRYRYNNSNAPSQYNDLIAFDLSSIGGNNTTYAIRVQRLKRQGSYVWHLYVDPYTSSKKEATTERGGTGAYNGELGTYANSSLLLSSTTENRFQFDEMKAYSMQLMITGANAASNGINNPLYAGQKNAVIYGLQAQARGLFDIYQIQFTLSGSITDVLQGGTMKFNKSVDGFFGNGDDTFLVNIDFWNSAAQQYSGLSDRFSSLGNADGTLATACYYFISADVRTDASSTASFAFTGAPQIQSSNSQANYSNTGSVTNTVSPAAGSGKTYDWTGNTSSDWSVSSNWSPVGIPDTKDLARIGVSTFANQPVLSTTKTVGNIVIGSAKAVVLTVGSGAVLTVNSLIENKAGATLAGNGTIDVKGNLIFVPTSNSTITSSVATLNVASLLLNAENAAVEFLSNGSKFNIKTDLQIVSISNTNKFVLGNNASLILNGAMPFALKGNYNINLSNGDVVYESASLQNVNTSFGYKNISFTGSGLKNIAGNNLSVSGNWTSSGGKIDLTTNNTTVSFNGGNQSITDEGSAGGNGVLFNNVSFNGGGVKTLSGNGKFSVAVSGLLSISGNTVLQAFGKLTLKSDVNGSASVASIPTGSSIQGEVTVERYIQGGSKDMLRTYRMLSSPVYDNSTAFINTDVVGNRTYKFTQLIDDMIVTGPKGAENGFDPSPQNNSSAFTYNQGYVAIPNINTSVNVGRGMYIFFRGNRDNFTAKVNAPFVDPESTVMTFKGVLNQQSITVPLVHGGSGYSLLGNPYAATIDWNLITKTSNVSKVVRIWNPNQRQYSTYNGSDGVNGGSRYIASGQSFFVQTSDNVSPSVTFTESAKMGGTALKSMSTIMSVEQKMVNTTMAVGENILAEETPTRIRVKLAKENTDNQDESLVVLKRGALAVYTTDDVLHLNGEEVFLASLSTDQKQLAINYMPEITNSSNIGLFVNATSSGNYSLQFNLDDMPVGFEIKLKDRYLNTLTNIAEGVSYALNINKLDTASFGSNRFVLMLAPQTTLPVVLKSFSANKTNEGVQVKWTTANEVNNSHFILERSGDDKVFVNMTTVSANEIAAYQWLDKSPLKGNNYYRLTQVDKDGKSKVYDPVMVKYELNAVLASVMVFPNLVDTDFTIKYSGTLTDGSYLMKVSDVSGRVVVKKTLGKTDLDKGFNTNFSANSAGTYVLELYDVNNNLKLGSSKLIKK